MSKRHRQETDFVQPDLPITPMLDMSFQLLAFFIMTFHPAPIEGHIPLALPRETPGSPLVFPPPLQDKPVQYVVRVTATAAGAIEGMTIVEEDSTVVAKALGADVQTYHEELKAITAQLQSDRKTAKIRLELDDNLLQAFVVQLVDTGIRAGFSDISPVPVDSRKR